MAVKFFRSEILDVSAVWWPTIEPAICTCAVGERSTRAMLSDTSIACSALVCLHVILAMWSGFAEHAGLSRGLGDQIHWRTFTEGMAESKRSKKPLVLIIHKTWCSACKAFKPQFAASREIQELSKHFVMVNTEDEEEPSDPRYTPDGGYIPRVLFLDPLGNVMLDVYNESGNQNYRYYYYDAEAVIGSMKRALQLVHHRLHTSRGGEL